MRPNRPAKYPMTAAVSNSSGTPNPSAVADCDSLRSLREYRLFQAAAVATVVLGCAILFSLNLVDPDLWGHVKYGQDAIAERALPQTATHTYTAPEHPWINHENIAELTFAVVYEFFGTLGLTLGKCLVGMGILGVMAVAARRRGAGPLVTWTFLLLVTLNLATFFPVRPQLLSFALCALAMFVLDRAFAEWPTQAAPKLGWLWCLPPLVVVWVNSHGAFVAGLCILLTYLGGRAVEMLYYRRAAAWKDAAHVALVGLACAAGVLVNPYGLDLPRWLAYSLGRPRPEITEWAAPSPSDPVFVPFVLLVGVFVLSTLLDRRRRDWTHIVILALVAWQAATHVRHIAFFAILCGFWLPMPVCGLVSRLRGSAPRDLPEIVLAPWLRRGLIGTLVLVFGLQTYALANRLYTLPVYRNMYPVDAVEFLAAHGLRGRLVVAFNWAQYAVAALSPEVQVQFDGRFRTCYPQEVIDQHFDFLLGEHEGRRFRSEKSGPIDGRAVLSVGQPDLILVDRSYPASVEHMEQEVREHPGRWVLLYQDGVAQLYGRSERYDNPAGPQYVPPSERIVTNETRTDFVPWPALPDRTMSRFALK